jgi:dTDP-4-amino-4,6-dideoxy-D-galactose acyltransferase
MQSNNSLIAQNDYCKYLEWDSSFFGFPIARVLVDIKSSLINNKIDNWAKDNKVRCLYYLCDANNTECTEIAEDNGYRLRDLRTTLEWSSKFAQKAFLPVTSSISIRSYEKHDLPSLKELARTSYPFSRFFRDPHFPDSKCGKMYAIWLEKCIVNKSFKTFIATLDGELIGYISIKNSTTKGEIILVAVKDEFHRQGIGSLLLEKAVSYFKVKGYKQISVVTQGINIKAQRLYTSHCFYPVNIELWFHKWYE